MHKFLRKAPARRPETRGPNASAKRGGSANDRRQAGIAPWSVWWDASVTGEAPRTAGVTPPSVRRTTKMHKLTIAAAAAWTALAASTAFAASPGDFRGAARLVTPVSAPVEARVAGVSWRCAADGCVGLARRYNTLDTPVRECRRVAARFGPVSAYASRGERLSRAGLVFCNRAARGDLKLAATN